MRSRRCRWWRGHAAEVAQHRLATADHRSLYRAASAAAAIRTDDWRRAALLLLSVHRVAPLERAGRPILECSRGKRLGLRKFSGCTSAKMRDLFQEIAVTIFQVSPSALDDWSYAQVQQGVSALLTVVEVSIGSATGVGVPARAVQLLNQCLSNTSIQCIILILGDDYSCNRPERRTFWASKAPPARGRPTGRAPRGAAVRAVIAPKCAPAAGWWRCSASLFFTQQHWRQQRQQRRPPASRRHRQPA